MRRRDVPFVNDLADGSMGSGCNTLPGVGLARDDFRVALLFMGSSLGAVVIVRGAAGALVLAVDRLFFGSATTALPFLPV